MTSEYTPTTEQVRRAYVTGMRQAFVASAGEHAAEFDRWLAAVKASAASTPPTITEEDVDIVQGLLDTYREGDRPVIRMVLESALPADPRPGGDTND